MLLSKDKTAPLAASGGGQGSDLEPVRLRRSYLPTLAVIIGRKRQAIEPI
jgi:hypothetical protein